MSKYSGKDGTVEVGATEYDVTSWEADETQEEVETTDTGSSGRIETLADHSDLKGSFELFYNTSARPVSLKVGTTLTTLALNADGSEEVLSIATARVTGLNVVSRIKGGIVVRVSWRQTGAWTWKAAS